VRQNIAVLGLFFGDEGKGRTVDYFASRLGGPGWVVRHNGGAQAGHTVQLDNGLRHVFHHHGSGSLAGVPTFLSRFFVAHPMLFRREHESLRPHHPAPVHIDQRCFVTTPYDMLLNEARELMRGDQRHGSVGVGFGETIERHCQGIPLCVDGLANRPALTAKLQTIREHAAQQLAFMALNDRERRLTRHLDWLESGGVFSHFLQDCEYFLAHATATSPAELDTRRAFIFEGAQGILLDEDFGCFPHVTRSRTGLRNALRVADELGIRIHHVYRVCRPYLTRHGRGPLPFECSQEALSPVIVDATNRPGPFQEHLRFAPFNFAMLETALRLDNEATIPSALVLTCCDQMPDHILCAGDGPQQMMDFKKQFLPRLRQRHQLKLLSWGAEREAMEILTPPAPSRTAALAR
jgi:adenylosuccinate synthase